MGAAVDDGGEESRGRHRGRREGVLRAGAGGWVQRGRKSKPRPEDLDIETGLASRAATEVFLRGQIELSAKQRTPCGLILIRLDTLEEFQRGHGKDAGSAILHEVARTLKDMMRRSDFLGDGMREVFWRCYQDAMAPLERVGARMKRAAGRVAISWWGDLLSVKVSASAIVVETADWWKRWRNV